VEGKKSVFILLGIIVIAVFSVSMFMLWPQRDGVFWITYLFILLGVIGVTVNMVMMRTDNLHFASNLTLVTISVVYLIACVVASIVAVAWLHMGTVGYVVLHIILFAVFLCIWLIGRSMVSYINKQD
jgi:hypothetical protein